MENNKTLSEAIAELEIKLRTTHDCDYKPVAEYAMAIIRTLVKEKDVLREACIKSRHVIDTNTDYKDVYEEEAIIAIDEALSLTDPAQPWKG